MSLQLISTRHFDRRAKDFCRAHPELRKPLAALLLDLESDPFRPHLRLHPLSGGLKGLHAVRLTRSYRMTVILRLEAHEIVLLDIGSHDEVYR